MEKVKSLFARSVVCPCVLERRLLRDRHQLFQFLMRLRPEFEPMCRQLLHRDPLAFDIAFQMLMVEETRLQELGPLSSDFSTTFVLATSDSPTTYMRQFSPTSSPPFSSASGIPPSRSRWDKC